MAYISGGDVNLNTDVVLSGLQLNGGVLEGTSQLTTSFIDLEGGSLATSGPINVVNAILNKGTLARDLTLQGSSNTIADIAIAAGFTLANPVGATLTGNVPVPGDLEPTGPGQFVNAGTFIKSGPNRLYLDMPTINSGLIQVQQNNLRITRDGTHTGAFDVWTGAQLEFSGNETLQSSSTVSGAGSLLILAGTSQIDGDVSTSVIRIAGGTLSGAGNLHPGAFQLESGTLARNLTLEGSSNSITNIAIAAGYTLTNPVGATLTGNVPGPGDVEPTGPGQFVNAGTFIKSGPNRLYLDMPTTNSGLIQVQQNNLRMTRDGTHTGAFDVWTGAQLEFSGNETLKPTSTVSGAGSLLVLAGTSQIDGDVSTSVIRIAGGTLSGAGNLHPGAFQLDSGTLARNLTLQGSSNTMGAIAIAAGSTLTNPIGATLTDNVPSNAEYEPTGPGQFVNEGTFIKTGPNRLYLDMPMTNSGLIQVQQNNLRMTRDGTHTGTFDVWTGAQLEFSGNETLTPGATVSGAGSLLILGGTSQIDSDVSTSVIRVAGGTMSGSGNLHPSAFQLDSGTLARDLTLSGNNNTITEIAIAAGRTLTNPAGATLTANVPGPGDKEPAGQGQFINAGTFIKTGANRLYLGMPNQNNGLMQVQKDGVQLAADGTHSGVFELWSGARVEFNAHQVLTPSASITGAGYVIVYGTLDVPGTGLSDYTGGTMINGAAGRVNISGAGTALGTGPVTIASNGVLSIEAASNLLPAQAVVQSTGALAVRGDFIPVSQIAPSSAGTFAVDIAGFASPVDLSVLGNGSMSLGSTASGTYVASSLQPGAGNTYRLGGGGGTLTLTQPDVLTGNRPLIVVGPGTVVFQQSQSFSGGTTIQSGTAAVGNSGAFGAGPILFSGGSLRADGGPIVLSNSITLGGNVTLAGSQNLTFAGGMLLTGNRTINVTNTGLTEISGSISQNAAGRTLIKTGPGTLVLSADNSFTGGLQVGGGTVAITTNQHYLGTTFVAQGGKLVLDADLAGTGSVQVLSNGTLAGNGNIAGATTIGSGGVIAPGASPGALQFASGLTMQSNSTYSWDLGALSTSGPGNDWDQLLLSGGPLSISSAARLAINFTGAASDPTMGDPFWSHTERWHNIVNLLGTATNPSGASALVIDNSKWLSFGTFKTSAATSGAGVDLVWTPVPEPATWMTMMVGVLTLAVIAHRRRT